MPSTVVKHKYEIGQEVWWIGTNRIIIEAKITTIYPVIAEGVNFILYGLDCMLTEIHEDKLYPSKEEALTALKEQERGGEGELECRQ